MVIDRQGVALGVCYSNAESLREAVDRQSGVYWSRKRGLWIKGATSGATQVCPALSLAHPPLLSPPHAPPHRFSSLVSPPTPLPRRFTASATTATATSSSLP